MLILVLILSALLLAAVLISLGFKPKFLTRITGTLLALTAVLGIIFYGYGYFIILGDVPQAVIRTLFSVFCMFLGRNDVSTISKAAPLDSPWLQVVIYAVHLFALYCSASALAASVAADLLRRLNLLFLRRGEVQLIYGVNRDTLSLAERLQNEDGGAVAFVGSPGNDEARILRMGAICFSGGEATNPTAAFIKKLGLTSGTRRLTVYAAGEDAADNSRWAKKLLEALGEAKIDPARTSLSILSEDEAGSAIFQNSEEHYGYGTVFASERHSLAARLMTAKWPVSRWMTFTDDGRAAETFEALIVGFGKTGQEVLRSLIISGQFEGGSFHATVIDLDYQRDAGSFFSKYPALRENYSIDYLDADAHSVAAFERLRALAPGLNYAVAAAGSGAENDKIASEYRSFMADLGCRVPILMVSDGVIRSSDGSGSADIFTPKLLSTGAMDAAAMVLNHQYHLAEGLSPQEDWAKCDYFSRMSCRAAADSIDGFLAAAHTDRETAAREGLDLSPETLENLAKTEHLRWCAFHYAMGYRAMGMEEFKRRCALFAAGKLKEKPGRDAAARLHVCLKDWEDLDELGRVEKELTGREVDYKEMDRANVRLIPEILRAAGGAGDGK